MDRIYVMQLVRSFQVGEINRRTFLKRASAAIGSMAAANLLLAACQPIRPEEAPPPVLAEPTEAAGAAPTMEGVTGAMVEYPDQDGETLMGYLARPDAEGPHPGVIVIQEWWGLDNHIKDVANRFAAEGFVALAPDLYHGQVTSEPDEARKLVMELDMAEAVSELQQAIAYLLEQDFVAGDAVGTVGFCMGGGLSLRTGLADENVGAVVAFYGAPLSDEEAAQMNAPVLGLYGAEDGGIPVESVEAMGEALDAAGVTNEIHIYEGAMHAFFNDTRAESYHAEASADAWQQTLDWFRTHLTT